MAAMSITSLGVVHRATVGQLSSSSQHAALNAILRTSSHPIPRRTPVLVVRIFNTRLYSSLPPRPPPKFGRNADQGKPPPPPPSMKQIFKYFMKHLTFRNAFSSLTPKGLKVLYRQSPGEVIAAMFVLAGLGCLIIYVIIFCVQYIYSRQFTRYPPAIAQSLRKALYYTDYAPDVELARKHYKRALEQCDEHGLDPFSDETLGIRIQVAAWQEKIGHYMGAITILESVWRDCLHWVATMEKAIADGSVDKSGVIKPPPPKDGDDEPPKQQENLWHKRTRLLAKAIGTSTKLGQLYGDDHVNDWESTQKRLTWAVETALAESKRRLTEGVKPDEGDWLSPEELGGAMESLASHFEARSQFHLAVPLLFSALRICDSPCHRPTIMNNLAVAFAQHPVLGSTVEGLLPDAPTTEEAVKVAGMPTTRKELLEAAWNWAKNAKNHAKDVEASQRTPECDEACAVALSNMGDIAALRNDAPRARRLFQQCIDLSKKIGFDQGVKQAQNGLRSLDSGSAAK